MKKQASGSKLSERKKQENWEETRLQFLSTIKNSNVDKKAEENEDHVLLCNYVDVYYNDFITSEISFMPASATKEEISKFQILKGDVIITKDSESADDIGIPALVDEVLDNVICGYHLSLIRPSKDICPLYLLYFFQSTYAQSYFEIYANGVTRFGLPLYAIKKIPILHPKYESQVLIAEYLQSKTAQIDALISKKEELLKLLAEKRTALITKAVTKGLNPDVKMQDSGVEWLGEIPEHWEVKKIKFVANCNVDKLPDNTDPDFEIRYVDISSVNFDHGITNKEDYVFEKAPSRARRRVTNGDTIVSTVRTYLKAIAYVESPEPNLIVSTGFAVLSPKSNFISSKFFSYLLKSQPFIQYVMANSNGVSYPAINPSSIMDFYMVIPPFKEQNDIEQKVEGILSSSVLIESKIIKAIEQLKEYRTALITHAVTGKLDLSKYQSEEEAS
ncbi:putative restriction endonuclease [Sporocytophaga myxococcoides]|uniref:Putative restriction endonuclease n=1 Tax=Sporocytophaga myxococcoides TaxID=153721 RepID=A0A098LGI0_9BACT|nr:restriction endonuclease subunit S [Sporocytophaga myxococcoides]GAL85564.1 putative restriction endonuclease [Sporocytophaga myxococcoides]